MSRFASRHTRRSVIAMCAVACGFKTLEAQTPSDAWLFRGDLERTFISSPLPQWSDWHARTLGVVRSLSRGAVGIELHSVERFGLRDEAAVFEAYRELWARAYTHVRGRLARDADVLPDWDLRAELFQGLEGGWEVSASWWHMAVPVASVDVLGLGAARYLGAWYLRGQVTRTRSAGRSVSSFAATARRFIGGPQELVELAGSMGSEVVVVAAGPVVDLRRTTLVQLRGQEFFTDRFGASGVLGYTTFEGAPDRLAVSLGILVRR